MWVDFFAEWSGIMNNRLLRHSCSRLGLKAWRNILGAGLMLIALVWAPVQAQQLKVIPKYPDYVSFGPSLIVNLASKHFPAFMRVEIEFYVLGFEDADVIKQFGPVIRDRLITLFGGRDMEILQSAAGREALREETLEVLRETLLRFANRPAIEDLYFTSFVMQ